MGEGEAKRTLALFFEGQFALLVVVFVLAAASVFATLERLSALSSSLYGIAGLRWSQCVLGSECMRWRPGNLME